MTLDDGVVRFLQTVRMFAREELRYPVDVEWSYSIRSDEVNVRMAGRSGHFPEDPRQRVHDASHGPASDWVVVSQVAISAKDIYDNPDSYLFNMARQWVIDVAEARHARAYPAYREYLRAADGPPAPPEPAPLAMQLARRIMPERQNTPLPPQPPQPIDRRRRRFSLG